MESNSYQTTSQDPDVLRACANPLREAITDTPADERTPLEKSIRRAQQTLSADLLRLDQLHEKKVEVVYTDFFAAQMQEKIAVMIYFTQQIMRDIAESDAQTLDSTLARRVSSLLVEVLFRLNAVDGLGVLYDFASAQGKRGNASFWQKVSRHYLQLMAMLPLARPQLFAFLTERPDARRDVELGLAAPDVQVSRVFRTLAEEFLRARKSGQIAPPAPAAYTAFYQQYVQEEPDAQTARLATRLIVQENIHRAIDAADITSLARWFTEGSSMAVRSLLQQARTGLAATDFLDLLVNVAKAPQVDPVRAATAILEMSAINRSLQANGGDLTINQHLTNLTMTDDSVRFAIARLAVQELSAVGAFNEILTIMERAPYVDVATEGIAVLYELRRLPLAKSIVARRATLKPAFDEAERQAQFLQGLMDAAWACQDNHMVTPYMNRLRDLKALHELETIANHHPLFSAMAKRILSELRLEMSTVKTKAQE